MTSLNHRTVDVLRGNHAELLKGTSNNARFSVNPTAK